MSYSFESWFQGRLNEIKSDLGYDEYYIDVFNEQDFIKPNLDTKHIPVVVKNLTASRVFFSKVQPLQIQIISEGNSLQITKLIFDKFCSEYNWYSLKEDNNAYKFQFTSPVVMNNFITIGEELRSILYITATVIELENTCDVEELKIDDNVIDFLTFTMNFAQSTDTQPFSDNYFAQSVKAVQTLGITIIVPCVQNELLTKIQSILKGKLSGNTDFAFEVKWNNEDDYIDYTMKLISCVFSSTPDNAPGITLGFSM